MKVHRCSEKHDADFLAGKKLDESHYDILCGGDEPCDVFKHDGSPLIKYRPNWFPKELCDSILPASRKAARPTTNRGYASGTGTKKRPKKVDGSYSKTIIADQVNSGIIGYFDRNSRYPFCRQTSFLISEAASWKQFLPYIERADEGFREFMPDRWLSQKEYASKTPKEWVIPQSTFTTVTVNRNWQTATHKDAGDLKSGFGVMSCIRNNLYEGAYLVFPAYRVAVNFGSGCLCLADVHEWHSNTAFTKMRLGYERISLIFYYRENMVKCENAEKEIDRVKNRKAGEPLY